MCSKRNIIKGMIISRRRLAHLCARLSGISQRTHSNRKTSMVSTTKKRKKFEYILLTSAFLSIGTSPWLRMRRPEMKAAMGHKAGPTLRSSIGVLWVLKNNGHSRIFEFGAATGIRRTQGKSIYKKTRGGSRGAVPIVQQCALHSVCVMPVFNSKKEQVSSNDLCRALCKHSGGRENCENATFPTSA